MAIVTDGCASYAILGYIQVNWGNTEGARVRICLPLKLFSCASYTDTQLYSAKREYDPVYYRIGTDYFHI